MFVCLALSLGANEDGGRGARGAIISNGRAKRWPGALAPNAPRSLESWRRRRPLPFLFSLFPCFPGFSHFRRSLFFALFRFHSFFFLPFSFPSFPAFVSFPPFPSFFMTQTDARLRPLAGPEATRRRGVCRFKSEAILPGRVGSAESPPPLAPCPLHSLIPCAAAPGRARRFDFSPGGLNRVELARPGRPVRRQEAHGGRGEGRRRGRQGGKTTCGKERGKKEKGWGRRGAARGKEERRRVAGVPASPKPRPPRSGRALARFFALPIVRFACGRSRANGFSCPKPSPTPCPPRRAESSPRPRRTAGSTC